MSNLTQTQEVVLALSAASLFGKQVNIPAGVDWQEIMEECRQQSVLLQTFPAAKQYLPEETEKKWSMHCNRIVANNVRVEWEHSQLHDMMAQAGIPYVVMKGCASSAYYPDSSLRTMGDVDFLIHTEDIGRTSLLVKSVGFTNSDTEEESIHITYYRSRAGVRSVWEMHWSPNGIPDTDRGGIIRGYLSTAIEEAVQTQTPMGTYMGPSVFHHGLIMLLHTASHMINTGIGLRHLCDWAVFTAGISEDRFCEIFEERLKRVGLWRFAQLLTQVSAAYLGCPEKTWAGKDEPALLEAVIEDVFAAGNFGRKDEQRINQAKLMTNRGKANVDETSLLGQFISTMNEKARTGFPASARYPILLPVGWLYVGIRHILRILTGKRPKINMNEMISGANKRKRIYREFKLFEEE